MDTPTHQILAAPLLHSGQMLKVLPGLCFVFKVLPILTPAFVFPTPPVSFPSCLLPADNCWIFYIPRAFPSLSLLELLAHPHHCQQFKYLSSSGSCSPASPSVKPSQMLTAGHVLSLLWVHGPPSAHLLGLWSFLLSLRQPKHESVFFLLNGCLATGLYLIHH